MITSEFSFESNIRNKNTLLVAMFPLLHENSVKVPKNNIIFISVELKCFNKPTYKLLLRELYQLNKLIGTNEAGILTSSISS